MRDLHDDPEPGIVALAKALCAPKRERPAPVHHIDGTRGGVDTLDRLDAENKQWLAKRKGYAYGLPFPCPLVEPMPYTIDPTFEVLDAPEGLKEQLGLADTSQQRLAET